jgi:hypothetical protein
MKWFSKLLYGDDTKKPVTPIIESGMETYAEDAEESSILKKLGDGKHVIHIMVQDKEVTLVFNDEEFKNGLLRGKSLTVIPREEEIQEQD